MQKRRPNSERRVRVPSRIIARRKYRVGISAGPRSRERKSTVGEILSRECSRSRVFARDNLLAKTPDARVAILGALIMRAQVKPAYDDLFAHCIRYYHQRVISSFFLTIKRTVYFKTN